MKYFVVALMTASNVYAAVTRPAPDAAILSKLKIVTPYNLVSQGNVSYSCSDIEGRALVGGSLFMSRFLLANLIPAGVGPSAIVRNDLRFLDGEFYGPMLSRGNAYVQNVGGHYDYGAFGHLVLGRNCEAYSSSAECRSYDPSFPDPIVERSWHSLSHLSRLSDYASFAATKLHSVLPNLVSVSRELATLPGQNVDSRTLGFNLQFKQQPGKKINVFYTNVEAIRIARYLEFTGDADSLFIVNVEGNSLTWAEAEIKFTGDISKENVLFNFYNASSLNLTGRVLFGSFMAPHAHVTFYEGRIEGGLFVASLDANPMKTDFHSRIPVCVRSGGQLNWAPLALPGQFSDPEDIIVQPGPGPIVEPQPPVVQPGPVVDPQPPVTDPIVVAPTPVECIKEPASVTVKVPQNYRDVRVCIDGKPTTKMGTLRIYETQPLCTNQTYYYTVSFCDFSCSGKRVQFRGGESMVISLRDPQANPIWNDSRFCASVPQSSERLML